VIDFKVNDRMSTTETVIVHDYWVSCTQATTSLRELVNVWDTSSFGHERRANLKHVSNGSTYVHVE